MGGVARWAVVIICGAALAGCASPKLVKRPSPCADQTVQIYFEPFSVEVTPEARQVLRLAADAAKHCQVEKVDVLGLADAVGAPDANLELSQKRADAVTAALAALGLPAAEFRVAAAGQADSVAPGGETRPLRRRADITLKLSKPK